MPDLFCLVVAMCGLCLLIMAWLFLVSRLFFGEITSPVEFMHCLVSPLHIKLREIERQNFLNHYKIH